ncbi:MAG: hypothetical protein Q7T82_16900 [Armatimonadota bacterium]|nr:hypothetical protein [Armatimonadota bacterium]
MQRIVVVLTLALLLALCVSQVQADRLILIPTGSVLDSGAIKAEAAFGASDGDSIFVPKNSEQINWVSVGISRFEVDARRLVANGFDKITVGVEAGVLPETLVTPGVGIGIRDVTDELERSYYLAVTKMLPLSDKVPLPIHDIKLHGGFGINGELGGFFVGGQIGLPMNLVAYAEYDSENFNAALKWIPIPKIGLKVYTLDSEFFYGADIKLAF